MACHNQELKSEVMQISHVWNIFSSYFALQPRLTIYSLIDNNKCKRNIKLQLRNGKCTQIICLIVNRIAVDSMIEWFKFQQYFHWIHFFSSLFSIIFKHFHG